MSKNCTVEPNTPDKFLSPSDVADHANVPEVTARGWCVRYHLGKKVGGRWRIAAADAEKFIAGEWPRDRRPE